MHTPSKIICPSCKIEIPENLLECPRCGERLLDENSLNPQLAKLQSKPKSFRRMNALIISLLSLLVGFLAGYGVAFFIDPYSSKNIYANVIKNKEKIENKQSEIQIKEENLKDAEKKVETLLNLFASNAADEKNFEQEYLGDVQISYRKTFTNPSSIFNSSDRYSKTWSEFQGTLLAMSSLKSKATAAQQKLIFSEYLPKLVISTQIIPIEIIELPLMHKILSEIVRGTSTHFGKNALN